MPSEEDCVTQAQGAADCRAAGLPRATEAALSAAASGPPRMTTLQSTADCAAVHPMRTSPLTPEQVYLVVHRLSRGIVYPEQEADERALRAFQQHLRSLGCEVFEDVSVPSGASEETSDTPFAVPSGATTEHATALPRDSTIPEANLGELLEAETMDTAQPSRKRPAAAEEEDSAAISDSTCMQSQKKKTPEAAAHSEADQGTDDGFVVPKRRHTARAKRLERVQPLPTANSFVDVPDEPEPMDEAEAPKRRAPAPPPITVSWKDTYQSFLEKFQKQGRSAPARKVQPGTSFASATKGESSDAPRGRRADAATTKAPNQAAGTQDDQHQGGRLNRPPTSDTPQAARRVVPLTDAATPLRPAAHAPATAAPPAAIPRPEAADLGAMLSSLSALLQQLPVLVTAAEQTSAQPKTGSAQNGGQAPPSAAIVADGAIPERCKTQVTQSTAHTTERPRANQRARRWENTTPKAQNEGAEAPPLNDAAVFPGLRERRQHGGPKVAMRHFAGSSNGGELAAGQAVTRHLVGSSNGGEPTAGQATTRHLVGSSNGGEPAAGQTATRHLVGNVNGDVTAAHQAGHDNAPHADRLDAVGSMSASYERMMTAMEQRMFAMMEKFMSLVVNIISELPAKIAAAMQQATNINNSTAQHGSASRN
ncbi:microtubule-associated protein 4-like [Schistocerca gregaria]|uniref:microtubule-associated protein 4-like n=1 Tax=Schistocerca gregaria TaxID=7010 RepID=UPI00211E5C90|nr:microtubule-associated protein 4-like [Schistocerca gregaria]